MALPQIDLGTTPDDGTGDDARTAGAKINSIITQMWDTITGGIAYLGGTVGMGIASGLIGFFHIKTSSNVAVTIEATATGPSDGPTLSFYRSGAGAADANFQIELRDDDYLAFATNNDTFSSRSVKVVITQTGQLAVGKTTSINSIFAVSGLLVYANNAAALVGGLTAGDFYKTAATGDATVMVTNAT